MSVPYDQVAGVSVSEMGDQAFPRYDGQFSASYQRLAGPPSHFDGVGFWYRPNNTEPLYERDSLLFNRSVANSTNSMEHSNVKHRRTRSGCFTCRSRRVKCDEKRPICDRCKKGNRECEFPQPSSSSKRSKHAEARSPQDPDVKDEQKGTNLSGLDTIKDESDIEEELSPTAPRRPTISNDRTHSAQSLSRKQKHRAASEQSPPIKDKLSPQSTTSSSSHSRAETPASSFHATARSPEIQARQAKIKTLKPDLQKYLQFQHDHMTQYHYFLKLDPCDFIHNEFIDLALTYEPLLYAAVGFAAYHYELRQPDGKLSHFLGYHSRSLALLRKSLEKGGKVTEATLLTVLQLATFEEYLGDWVNLVGHHRAAYTMFTDLFSLDTFMDTDLGRRIFSWYARTDVIVSLMAGAETRLDRSWFMVNLKWFADQIATDPENDVDIDNTLAYFIAENRMIGMDMSILFSKLPKNEITLEQFHAENAKIVNRVRDMKAQIERVNDEYYRVKEFPMAKVIPLKDDDIVNPYLPGGLFKDVLWPLNYMWIDWYAIEQMQKHQTNLLMRRPPPPELEQISLEQCRIYEAIERWPEAPEGAVLGAHASLGLATVFLKKDERHTMWARRKLAGIERLGYVFPPVFRRRMAEAWGLTKEQAGEDNIEDWWLPNDEGRLPLLTEIRKVVQERHEDDQKRGDTGIGGAQVADVRDLKAIFAKLDLRTQSAAPTAQDGMEGLSPRSEGNEGSRSTGSSFSPTSATSTTAGYGFNDDPTSTGSGSTIDPSDSNSKGVGKRGSDAGVGDRMSGIWGGGGGRL